MINTFPNTIIYNLAETNFIAGCYKELYIDLYTSANNAIDVRNSIVIWTLSPYECGDYIILSKSPVLYSGYFMVPLFSTDTISLSGKYIQKASVAGSFGYAYNVGQGIINIIPALGGA
jgi:hypothetical protein